MIDNANKPGVGTLATVIGLLTLLLGAGGAFGQIKAALNTIWDVPPGPPVNGLKNILNTFKQQFISFTMVLGTGFLLLVSLILSAALSAVVKFLGDHFAAAASAGELVNFVLSFAVVTLLFAGIYKVLPDVRIAWRDVWIGAAVTALLFTIGKWLIGLYLGHSSSASAYGAAGSLVVILLWIYYSAQILFLGAEFTQVYARTHGTHALTNPLPLAGQDKAPNEARLEKEHQKSQQRTRRAQDSLVLVSQVFGILLPAVMLAMRIWQVTGRLIHLLSGPESDRERR
jgi:membrane protein